MDSEPAIAKQCFDCGCCSGREYFAEFQEGAFMPDCIVSNSEIVKRGSCLQLVVEAVFNIGG